MAATSIWRVNSWLGKVVVYVENPDKTANPEFYGNGDMTERECQGLDDVIAYAVSSRKTEQHKEDSDKDKIRSLRQNLKTVEQKIANIVNIIANTGSAALVTQLTQLEREKELLDVQIQEEERSAEESELDEDAIFAAFRQAQKMFHNGTLPQMEQIINLYLDRVVVFPDYVEIHLNNVPTNLLNPSETKDEPALGGLHTFYTNL